MRATALISALVAISAGQTGCATWNVSPRYEERRVDERTFEVEVRGAADTPETDARRRLNQRCAELTVQSGYTHYVVTDRHDSEDRLTRLVAGPAESGGRVIVEVHPIARATIRMSKDDPPPPGAHDAREELRSLPSP